MYVCMYVYMFSHSDIVVIDDGSGNQKAIICFAHGVYTQLLINEHVVILIVHATGGGSCLCNVGYIHVGQFVLGSISSDSTTDVINSV